MAGAISFSSILKDVGARIRAVRRERGLTQEQAAGRIGIEVRRYQRIEAGEINVTLRTLWTIATALGVSIGRLIKPEPR